MFTVNEDGNITYNEDILDDGSLFGSGVLADPPLAEDVEPLPEVDTDGAQLFDAVVDTVSGSDAKIPDLPGDQTINVYAVYAVPSSSTGFPNTSSLSYLEDVVQGYPSDYWYIAYRTDEDYAQGMILFVAPTKEVNGNTVTLQDVDIIELEYSRNNYGNNIRRIESHESRSTITIPDTSIAYTNCLPGYGTFDIQLEKTQSGNMMFNIVIGAGILFLLFRLIGGGSHA